MKLDLGTGIAEANNIGAGVIGLGVDPNTGLVYTTTYHNQLRVYDTSTSPFTLTDYESISAGCGVTVPSSDVSYKPPLFYLKKVDVNEPNSVLPGDYITYRITYGPNSHSHNNVVLTDYLSHKVDFNSASGNGVYDPNSHIVTWNIGHLDAYDPCDSVTLTVKVNEGAEPNGVITNYCEIETDSALSYATADTNVGSWQPNSEIIYVNYLSPCAPGTGMSWRFAYRDLQDALERAGNGYGSQIWVAEGIYKPTLPTGNPTFQLLDGVPIYGGFAGIETALSQRNWLKYETFLSGDWDNDGIVYGDPDNSSYVIKASEVNQTSIIDGFTIIMGYYAGITVDGGSPIIQHDKITENGYDDDCNGIFCRNHSLPTITDCNIQDNNGCGIRSWDSEPNIINSIIKGNGKDGIYGLYSYYYNTGPNIVNCIIKSNGEDGIKLYCNPGDGDSPAGRLMVSNCIIEENSGNGIDDDGNGYIDDILLI